MGGGREDGEGGRLDDTRVRRWDGRGEALSTYGVAMEMYSYVPLWVVANEYVRKATLAKTRNRYKSHFPASFLSFFSISSPTFCENSDTSNTCLFCLPLKRQLV